MKTDESTGQLQERLIRFTKLFPANQKATPAIEPGKQAFDHPSSRRFTRFQAVGKVFWWLIPLVILRIEPDMWLIAPFIQFPIDGIMIVGCIQAQVLRSKNGWFGTLKAQGIKSGEQQFAIMAIGSLNSKSQWQSTTITQDTPFGSLFAAGSRERDRRRDAAKGALTVELSTLCQSQAIPTSSS